MIRMHELTTILPPPNEPYELPNDADWARCASELIALPDDYMEFMRVYGTGVIDEFLYIYNPVARNRFLNLISQSSAVLAALTEIACKFPARYSMMIYPQPGGFFPFGGTDNGNDLFWITDGDPNQWTVAVMGARSPNCHFHSGGMVDFLVDMLTRRSSCSCFPDDFPNDLPLAFRPVYT